MKRIKIQALALSLALTLMAVSSCSKEETSEIKVRSNSDREITEITETTEETTTPTTEATTEATTTEATTEETTVENTPAPVDDTEGTHRYYAYLDLAGNLAAEGNYLFSWAEDYDPEIKTYDLKAFNVDTGEYTLYFYSDAEGMTEKSTGTSSEEDILKYDHALSYDEFAEIPFMIRNVYFSLDEVDHLDDGRYFGLIVGVSTDANKIIARLGRPITLTDDEYLALSVGDEVCGYEVVYVDESKTDGSRVYLGESGNFWFLKGSEYQEEGDDTWMLFGDNDIPMTQDAVNIFLDVPADVAINDHYGMMTNADEATIQAYCDENGWTSPLANTACFYYLNTYEYRFESSNGWLETSVRLYPLVLENGQIKSMNLEWR